MLQKEQCRITETHQTKRNKDQSILLEDLGGGGRGGRGKNLGPRSQTSSYKTSLGESDVQHGDYT